MATVSPLFRLPAKPLPYTYRRWKEDPVCKAPGCGQVVERAPEACIVHNQLWHRMCADRANYYPDDVKPDTAIPVLKHLKKPRKGVGALKPAPGEPPPGFIPGKIGRQRARLWRENPDHICGICGNEIERIEDATIDHIIPRSRGGRGRFRNLQLAHGRCNHKKGDKLP